MKACKECHYIFEEGEKCPACDSKDISDKFSGRMFIMNPPKSKVAQKLDLKIPGVYAVKVR